MMNTKFIVISILYGIALPAMDRDQVIYKEPYVVAQITNESENIIFMSGYDENRVLHADTLNPDNHVNFWVRDEQPVKISTNGIYCIYLNFHYDKRGYPQDTRLIFEKLETARISNKIGLALVYRKQLPVCPFGACIPFRILLDETVVMISDTKTLPDDCPLSTPALVVSPPSTF